MRFKSKQWNMVEIVYGIKLRLGHWVTYFAPHFPYSVVLVAEYITTIWD